MVRSYLIEDRICFDSDSGSGGVSAPRRTEIRGQDHMLAYITPKEGTILKAFGGSGEPGPMGIPAYPHGGGPGGSAGAAGAGGAGGAGSGDEDEEGGGFSDADADQGFGFGGGAPGGAPSDEEAQAAQEASFGGGSLGGGAPSGGGAPGGAPSDPGGGGPIGSAGQSGSGRGPDSPSQDVEDSYGVIGSEPPATDPLGLANTPFGKGVLAGWDVLGLLGMTPAVGQDLADQMAADADNVGEGPEAAFTGRPSREPMSDEEEEEQAIVNDLAVNYLQNPFYAYSGTGNLYNPYGFATGTLVDLLQTQGMTQPTQADTLGLFGNPGDFV
jgi:hypothetical protein